MIKIPKIIHQTYINEDIPSHWEESRKQWQKLHPDWKYMFWTDDDLEKLVKNHYPQYFDSYLGFKHNIMRVDFGRTLILHRHGGVYSDLDIVPVQNITSYVDFLNRTMEKHQEVVLAETRSGTGRFRMTNFLMMSVPNAEWWTNYWEYVVQDGYKKLLPWWFKIGMFMKYYEVLGKTGPSGISVVYNQNPQAVRVMPSLYIGSIRGKNEGQTNDSFFKHVQGDSWNNGQAKHAHFGMKLLDNQVSILWVILGVILLILVLVLCIRK